MISNKLDADRGCNENLDGDRGAHMHTNTRDTQPHTHIYRYIKSMLAQRLC